MKMEAAGSFENVDIDEQDCTAPNPRKQWCLRGFILFRNVGKHL
jgi:hypothetical protein